MAAKPRTTRSKRSKNATPSTATANNNSNSSEPSYLESASNTMSTLSIPQKVGLGVSAVALLSAAVIRLSSATKTENSKKASNKATGTPFGDAEEYETMSWPASSSTATSKSTKGGKQKLQKIPSNQVTQAFQTCLSSKRPQQQLVAEQFYQEINKWKSEQLDIDGQTIVVNFLFWYYRSANVPQTHFTSQQADHIRYWASFPTTNDTKWDYYNIKFDYLYSTALLQRSIPYMKKFYQWVSEETPRAIPDDASSRKPNYYLTRFQAACILGDWQHGVKAMGSVIKELSSKATAANAPRSDYFMHYTLRALELPASNPNFGLLYKIVDRLQDEFPASECPPPVFTNWNIVSFRYRNVDETATFLNDQEFVFASNKIKDDEGFYQFYPSPAPMTSRLHKKINIWGRVCQFVSPVFGAAGFLPLTGSWSDTKLYAQTNWTFRGNGNRLTRKHVVMRVERWPFEKEVESKDYFGKLTTEKGYVWRGQITIHMKRLPQGMTMRSLYDSEGDDFYGGEKEKATVSAGGDGDGGDGGDHDDEVKGNGAVAQQHEDETAGTATGTGSGTGVERVEENESKTEIETQVYDVELVINVDDPLEKDKELKKRLLSAMNSSSNVSSPRDS